MNVKPHKIFALLIGTLAAIGLTVSSASADGSAGWPLSIKATLVTPSKITLGEPILIRYEIANNSGQKVGAHLGLYGTDWFTLDMRDAQGNAVPSIPDTRPAYPQGACSTQNGFIKAGNNSSNYIPVTKRLNIQRPGLYTLTIHVNLPYTLDGTSTEEEGDILADAAASALMETQDFTFSIRVTNTDPIRLQTTVEALRKATTDPQGGTLNRASMDLLFFMPEAQAAATWRTMAHTNNMSTDSVARELEELHTATAVDILVEMLDIPNLGCTPISDRINRVYNAGSPALREHIKAIARSRGFEMPKVAGTPFIYKGGPARKLLNTF